MRLLQMSISGGILILAIIVLRAIVINRVPKGTFLALWGIALLRLLLPFSVPSALSVYNLADSAAEALGKAVGYRDGFMGQSEGGGMEASDMQRDGEGSMGGGRTMNEEQSMDSMHTMKEGHPMDGESSIEGDSSAVGMLTVEKGSSMVESGTGSGAGGIYSDMGDLILKKAGKKLVSFVWCAGTMLCAAYFAASDIYLRKKYRTAVLLRSGFLSGWLSSHKLRRQIIIRCSDRIQAPMTYGILHPVILLPQNTTGLTGSLLPQNTAGLAESLPASNKENLLPQNADVLQGALSDNLREALPFPDNLQESLQDNMQESSKDTSHQQDAAERLPQKIENNDVRQLELILQHEYVHIRRFDNMTKLIAAAALCIHWFNPLAWAMYFLFNRDLELACDESVVRGLGPEGRKAYALTLIDMEERKSGLSPMYSGFSKNAIEERITAIMKMKKITFGAILLAAMLVASVATVFATSAMERNRGGQSISVPGLDYTEEEWEELSALRFDGYEDMTVSEFQNRAWTLMDRPEYRDAIERFSVDDRLYEMRDSNETASYLFYVLEPLTAEKWRTRSFGGSVATDFSGAADNAMLEYTLALTVWNPDSLTVREYRDARLGISKDLRDWFLGRTKEELQDAALMRDLMFADDGGEIPRLAEEWSSESLGVNISNTFYSPLAVFDEEQLAENEALDRMSQQMSQAQWDRDLAPYAALGLTYSYDQGADEVKMYFQGKEVRGIVDEEEGMWISAHAGITTYAPDAVELYAVYEDGKLTGLREATPEEQEEWTKDRQNASKGLQTGEDEARGTPGTEEDYRSLLALKTAGYKEMSLAEFNQDLLDWANEDYDRMERIGMDDAWDDIQVTLGEEELSFVRLTVLLSGLENGERVRSNYREERDIVHDQSLPDKIAVDGGMGAWCSLYYKFSYHIDDANAVTVGERDRCIGGMMEDIRRFWEETDIEAMLKMEETDVVGKLQEIAEKWSSQHIAISIREDYVGFERMDERGRDGE